MSADNITQRVEELERRIKTIEGLLSDRVLDKEQSHIEARTRDARSKLTVGETRQVVVRDVEQQEAHLSKQGITKIEGIVTFIKRGQADFEVGDTLRVKISDVQSNAAEACAIENVG